MRKWLNVVAGIFCAGVLLTGIGCGLVFVEYSSLEYSGKHMMGEEYVLTENLDYELKLQEDQKVYVEIRGAEVEYDNSVPKDTVRYVVTYNEKIVQPHLLFMPYEKYNDENEEVTGVLFVQERWKDGEFDLIMENKDKVLQELKNRQLGSWVIAQEQMVRDKVLINPSLEGFVEVVR